MPDRGGATKRLASALAVGVLLLAGCATLPVPTPIPTPTPTPVSAFAGFDDGVLTVGKDIQPGTYRLREAASSLCSWKRLSGLGGSLAETIALDALSGFVTVTIAKTDAGFTSAGCGHWTADLSAVITPAGPFADEGVFIVGTDIAPGTWRSGDLPADSSGCGYERLSGFGGSSGEIIASYVSAVGGVMVTIAPTDRGFRTQGCGTWTKTK